MGRKGISGLSYRDSGVDIDAGNALVEVIKTLARATARAGVVSEIGGFGALFDLKAAGYRDPILVASSDGAGTKLLVAGQVGRHESVGIDLVAMCVNDLVVQGAEPLFFLDYLATGRLDVTTARQVVSGIAAGCRLAGCALIGGETAEMPGLYAEGDYDLAGFAVGAAERGRLVSGEDIAEGDVILGLASSGLHASGFSLVRRLVAETGLNLSDRAPFADDRPLGEVLLDPTRIYVKSCLAANAAGGVKAMAHITGGGLVDNIPRVLPDGLAAVIDAQAWSLPPVFAWLAGAVELAEMARTFNCGIGMAVVVAADRAGALTTVFEGAGETVIPIGRIAPSSDPAVIIEGMEEAWRS